MNEKHQAVDPEDDIARMAAEATNDSVHDKALYEHPGNRKPRTAKHSPARPDPAQAGTH